MAKNRTQARPSCINCFNDPQEEESKKFLPFDDVVKLVHQAEAAPDKEGNYHDYVELCKLYDKNENGTMMLAELENILSNLGNCNSVHH